MVKLSELCETITKGTTPTTLGYEFQEKGIGFLKIECFDEDGNFIPNKMTYISEECNERMKRSQLKKNDILFSIAGAIERVAIVSEDMLPANINQALAIVRIKRNDVFIPYIKLILASNIVKEQYEKQKQGVAQLNLSLKNIGDLRVPICSMGEQIKYVYLFENIQKVVCWQKAQLKSYDELLKSRFVEMFGNPVLNSLKWKQKPLSLLTTKIGSGATPKGGKESYVTEGITLIRSMNVHNGCFEYKDLAYISAAQAAKLDNVIVEKEDILFNITGASVARCCVVPDEILPARVNQHVCIIRCNNSISPRFFNYLLIDDNYQELLWSIAGSGATREAITKQQVENLSIIVPPKELQDEFEIFVQQIDKLKVKEQKNLEKVQILFDILMQQYFG